MKTTGFIRKIDKLGRICLPIEFRRKENLQTDDKVELVISGGGLLMRRYEEGDQLVASVRRLKESVIEDERLTDREKNRLLEQMDALGDQICRAAGVEEGEDDDA